MPRLRGHKNNTDGETRLTTTAVQTPAESRDGPPGHKRTNSGGHRAFHDLDSMEPLAGGSQSQSSLGGAFAESRMQRLAASCSERLQSQRVSSKPFRLMGGAFAVLMMLFFRLRFA